MCVPGRADAASGDGRDGGALVDLSGFGVGGHDISEGPGRGLRSGVDDGLLHQMLLVVDGDGNSRRGAVNVEERLLLT